MNPHRFLKIAAATLLSLATASAQQPHTFTASGRQFLLDGKPYQIIAGDMHYPRVPRSYWPDRLHKMKQMGLNTLTTYAFWNLHEPHPGVYDFSGQNDLAEYLREAQAEGLHVILRPGPYVCAEWELGGYPSWLLKDRSLRLRSTDPKYQAAVHRWFTRLAQEVKPLLLKNGGPIIAIQVENEYGAFGSDQTYLNQVREELIKVGLGDVQLFTSNQAGDLAKGSLPDLPSVVNFGSGHAEDSLRKLEAYRPDGPRMVGEYWAGWFDKWGEEHHQTDAKREAAELQSMLEKGDSVSIYMFHGGTTFGFMNGADSHHGTDYHPDTTSYDYDAPLDEAGNPREKYSLYQQAILRSHHPNSTVALALPVTQYPSLATYPIDPQLQSASLWQNLPTPIHSPTPLTFEDLDQNFGYVLYRTQLQPNDGGKLTLNGLHDYAQVYIDQKLIGTLDRRIPTDSLEIPRQTQAATLDILVENTGRINYSHAILTERAGLTGTVTLNARSLTNWDHFSLPMDNLSTLKFTPTPCAGPCFYTTTMHTPEPRDTYLDTHHLHKGQLWIGTHNLGRFWSIGPQFTLYTPGAWLERNGTPITFFDLLGDPTDRITSVKDPSFGPTTATREAQ